MWQQAELHGAQQGDGALRVDSLGVAMQHEGQVPGIVRQRPKMQQAVVQLAPLPGAQIGMRLSE